MKRRKNRASRPNGNGSLAFFEPPVGVQTLPHGQAGMQNRDFFPEKPLEFCQKLGRQGNFRHQKQGFLSVCQAFFNEFDKNLGFPGTGNAKQQGGVGFFLPVQRTDSFKNLLLFRGKAKLLQRKACAVHDPGGPVDLLVKIFHHAFLGQGFQNPFPDARPISGVLFPQGPCGFQNPDHFLLLSCQGDLGSFFR